MKEVRRGREEKLLQSNHLTVRPRRTNIFKDLHKKHSAKYDMPRLRLWSRIIAAGIHDDYDEPQDIPPFAKSKRAPKEAASNCNSGAAVAIVEALQDKGKATTKVLSIGISPIEFIGLYMKNFKQLRYLQSLLDDGILSEVEYTEQKWYSRVLKNYNEQFIHVPAILIAMIMIL